MKMRISIQKISNQLFIGHCRNLPGCAIEADTEHRARQLLKAAITAYVISHKQRNEKLPI